MNHCWTYEAEFDLSDGCCEGCFAVVYVTYRADVQVLLCSGVDVISRSCKTPAPACSRQAVLRLYVQSATMPSPELLK